MLKQIRDYLQVVGSPSTIRIVKGFFDVRQHYTIFLPGLGDHLFRPATSRFPKFTALHPLKTAQEKPGNFGFRNKSVPNESITCRINHAIVSWEMYLVPIVFSALVVTMTLANAKKYFI
jgi:hypothetical protein